MRLVAPKSPHRAALPLSSPAMLHLAAVQFKPGKGDYAENLERIGEIFGRVAARQDPPDLLGFPESSLTGYLLEGGVRDLAVTAGVGVARPPVPPPRTEAPPPPRPVPLVSEARGGRSHRLRR